MTAPQENITSADFSKRKEPSGAETQSMSSVTFTQEIAGKYRLVNPIGEGGMGTVWLAEQRQPVKRLVAMKLIKSGMDSKAVLARFEAERQALALMDHPNIAKILDGGIAESGSPFFVMELVKGVPINDFCDSRKLSVKERLELFVPVCQAIQHAHQKGIIHRDIKPSNVLVALYDDKPVPKVIDFGVAKATGQALTEKTLVTGFGVVGTPQYMSPEQATLNQLDIDTRSDIYSLGVLLYELLTGSPPFQAKELQAAGYMEILRLIREVEPAKPSTKVSTADALPEIAKARSLDPAKLTGLLRSELDWVVMKAIEKDRGRRYETANAFASDIERYLHGEPVRAHPPSTAYRLRKFVRKNRGPVIAASLVCVAILAGLIGTTVSLFEANRLRIVAESQTIRAQQAEDEALEAYRSATDDTLTNLITSKEYFGPQEKTYLKNTIERWQKFADRKGEDERSMAIRAEGHYRVGKLLQKIDDIGSRQNLDAAAIAYDELFRMHPHNLGYKCASIECKASMHIFRDHFEIQEAHFSKIVNEANELVEKEPGNKRYLLALADSLNGLQSVYFEFESIAKANAIGEREIVVRRQALKIDPSDKELQYSLIYSEILYWEYKNEPSAQSIILALEAIVARAKAFANSYVGVVRYANLPTSALQSLAWALHKQKKTGKAIQTMKEAVNEAEKLVESFPNDSIALNKLSMCYNDLSAIQREGGQAKEGLESIRKALAISERLFERFPDWGEHPLATAHWNLVEQLAALHLCEECISESRKLSDFLTQQIETFEDKAFFQTRLFSTLATQGSAWEALDRPIEALKCYEDSLRIGISYLRQYPQNETGISIAGISKKVIDLASKTNQIPKGKDAFDKLIDLAAYRREMGYKASNYPFDLIQLQLDYASFLSKHDSSSDVLEWSQKSEEILATVTETTKLKPAIFATKYTIAKNRAIAFSKLHKLDDSQKQWTVAIELTPPTQQAIVRALRAQTFYLDGYRELSLQDINELAKSATLSASSWFQFALIYAKEALVTPEQSELYRKRSLALLAKAAQGGFFDIKLLDTAESFEPLRELPDYVESRRLIEAQYFYSQSGTKTTRFDHAGAIADLDRAIELNPDKSIYFNNRGWAKHNLQNESGALADYEAAIRLEPTGMQALVNRVFLIATARDNGVRDPMRAMHFADELLKLPKLDGYVYTARACAIAANDQFDAAIEEQKKAMADQAWLKDTGIDGGQYAESRIDAWTKKVLWYPEFDSRSLNLLP